MYVAEGDGKGPRFANEGIGGGYLASYITVTSSGLLHHHFTLTALTG